MLSQSGIIERVPLMKYVAAIKWKDLDTTYAEGHICAGAIVSRTHVITAAHCGLDDHRNVINASELIVAAGYTIGSIYDKDVQTVPVRKIIVHPEYKAFHEMDVAIFVLDGELSLHTDIVETLSIAIKAPLPYEKCTMLGFGVMFFQTTKLSQLLQVSMEIWPDTLCESHLSKSIGYDKDKFCAGEITTFGEQPCEMTASEPLICNDVVYGLSIFNIGCNTMKGFAAVFVNLMKYNSWLTESCDEKISFFGGQPSSMVDSKLLKRVIALLAILMKISQILENI